MWCFTFQVYSYQPLLCAEALATWLWPVFPAAWPAFPTNAAEQQLRPKEQRKLVSSCSRIRSVPPKGVFKLHTHMHKALEFHSQFRQVLCFQVPCSNNYNDTSTNSWKHCITQSLLSWCVKTDYEDCGNLYWSLQSVAFPTRETGAIPEACLNWCTTSGKVSDQTSDYVVDELPENRKWILLCGV